MRERSLSEAIGLAAAPRSGRRKGRRHLAPAVAAADLVGLLAVALAVAHLRFDLRVAPAPVLATPLLAALVGVAGFWLAGLYRFPHLQPLEEAPTPTP